MRWPSSTPAGLGRVQHGCIWLGRVQQRCISQLMDRTRLVCELGTRVWQGLMGEDLCLVGYFGCILGVRTEGWVERATLASMQLHVAP